MRRFMMQIHFEHDPDRFQALAPEWDPLVMQSGSRSPFLLHAFQSAWWATRGGGEWPDAELWLGLGREGGGGLSALAPLFYAPQRRALMFLGSIEIADTLDFIGPTADVYSLIPALLDAAAEAGPVGWETLDLYNIPEASSTIPCLEAASAERGWRIDRERLQPAPYLVLGSSWEGYLDQIDSKQRRELKRKLRRAELYPQSVRWRWYEPGQDLSRWVNTLLELMANDPQKRTFLTDPMRRHFHLLAEAAERGGWLQLALLEVGGEAAFGYFNFDFDNVLWIYNSGFNPQHAALSPGWVLMGHIIRWGIEHGRRGVDFLRGAETYKYRLGGVDRYIERVRITR